MIEIRSKLESDAFILASGMNYTPFKIVRSPREALDYLYGGLRAKKEPFSIRFKGAGMQPFLPNLCREGVYTYCYAHFSTSDAPLGIYEATEDYDDYRCCNCEIRINPDCTVDAHYCKSDLKMRDALRSPGARHVVGADMDFKPLRWAIDYLCKFDVIGPVVELTKFRMPVGVKNESIVCWEVRNF